MMVRRFLFMGLCLVGLGVVVFVIVLSRRRDVAARAGEPGGSWQSVSCEPAPERVVAAPVVSVAAEGDSRAVEQVDVRMLQEMAEIRADVIAGVSRRPLFLMAKKRGVSCGLFVASKWDLFDAILEAEGLSPDRQDSSPSAQRRLRQLAAEAYRREAEETERRDAAEAYRREADEPERRDLVERSPKPAQPRAHLPWRRFKSA
jgi:hypothetical protein